MIQVSDRWKALIGGIVRWEYWVEISRDGVTWVRVNTTTCKVTEDSGAKMRFKMEAEIASEDVALVSVFGSQARVFIRNIETGEVVQKGHYRVETRSRTMGGRSLRINGSSYESHIIDGRLPFPKVFNKDSAGNMVRAIVGDILPVVPIKFLRPEDEDVQLPDLTVTRDRWAALDGKDGSTSESADPSIAKALGCRVHAGPDGSLIVGPPSSLTDDPVWEIKVGEGGTELSAAEAYDRDPIYNGVSVRGLPREGGQGARTTVGPVVVVDGDPKSGTYWDRPVHKGGFGKVPVFYASPLLTNLDQCRRVGISMLAPHLGARKQLEVEAMFDPSFEAGDVGLAVGPGGNEKIVVDKIAWDLNQLGMNIDCRASASTEAGKVTVLIGGGDDEAST